VGDDADGLDGFFADVGVEEQDDGVFKRVAAFGVGLALLLVLVDQLHRQLDRLQRLYVAPVALLLVVYPLAGRLDDSRDVLVAVAPLHSLLEPHPLETAPHHLLFTFDCLQPHSRRLGHFRLHWDLTQRVSGASKVILLLAL
jgi:4-amino-4-deoxy-L-arabinose transferase-like glycosyltransferase